jgi:hypothetical protein
MKNLLIFLSLLLVTKLYAQPNCPIFPKAKKQNNHFWSSTYTTFGANTGLYKGKPAADGSTIFSGTTVHLGVSQCFKKRLVTHTLLSFAQGSVISNDAEGLSIGFYLGATYFFKKSFSGYGVAGTLNGYGEQTHHAIHLVYAKNNRKTYGYYELGGGFIGKNYFVNFGVKVGILVFK